MTHSKNPLTFKMPHWPADKPGWPMNAGMINAEFGFPDGKRVPANFSDVRFINGHLIWCLQSQPNRKHRMRTRCPICNKVLTPGCLDQHMRKIHKEENS